MAEQHGTQHHHANYFAIFVALCVLTLLSAATDFIEFRNMLGLIVVVLGIALAKALFVLTYFMHLKFEGRWKYLLLSPTIILAIGIPLALLPDIGVHYYTVAVPQVQSAEHGSPAEQPESQPEEPAH